MTRPRGHNVHIHIDDDQYTIFKNMYCTMNTTFIHIKTHLIDIISCYTYKYEHAPKG
jgi:hypothetical protein